MPDYDAIIIGAGHNSLTAAGYLGRANKRVKVLERRSQIGGAAITEEFHPGFRNSVYSYGVSLLHPKVIADLRLSDFGLQILERPAGTLSILENDAMRLSRDPAQAKAEIARFCPSDAERVDAFDDLIAEVAVAVRQMALSRPPNFGGGLRDLLGLAGGANQIRKLSNQAQATFAELMTRSLGDYLDSWFDGEAFKGILGLEGVIGNFADPYDAGTAYVLLHHAFGEVNGRVGAWGIVRGGMGAITEAMAGFARSKGVEIEADSPVAGLLVEDGRVRGVELADGRTMTARVVGAGIHPQTVLTQLMDSELLDAESQRRIKSYRSHSATFRMNVALSELPAFSCVEAGDNRHFKGAIEFCPSLSYMQTAYAEARVRGWSRRPVISFWVPTTQDDTLAPEGGHVASLFCQHFQRHLPNGQSWDDVKGQVADDIIGMVDEYAPNFRASVVGRQIKSPLDIERDLGMVGGDIFHGALHLDQMYSMRPIAGAAGYEMPVKGLYLCGSGAHPGGGVSGLPGHNAAREMLRAL